MLAVSIIVPVYNVSLYVERCLRSILAQTYPVKECIIVDDASPDDSIAKCEKLIDIYEGYTRFSILHHSKNLGLSAARNTGLKAAIGDFIFYLDSDDEITPDCIEKLAKPIERDPRIEMVQGSHQVFSVNPGRDGASTEEEFVSSVEVRKSFFDRGVLLELAWNKLISKRFLIENSLFFKEGVIHEDFIWIFYVVKNLCHLYVIPEITYHYYLRPFSICTRTSKTEKAFFLGNNLEDIASHFTPGEEAREAGYYLSIYYHYFFRNPGMDCYKRALPFFEKALSGSEYQRERRRLWVLKLSSKSEFLHWILFFCMKVGFLPAS